jgi:hypothetical protein
MSGSEYLHWSHGQFEKMTFFPPDPLAKKELNNIIAKQEVEQQDQGDVEQQVSTDCDDEGSSSSPGENRVVTREEVAAK